MTRPRKIIAATVAAAMLAILPRASAPGAELPLDAIEYKLRLVPEMVSAERRGDLWALIGAKSAAAQKKCRLVQFLDVIGDDLQRDGFIVRHRAKLRTKVCPASIPKTTPLGDLTLKYRTVDEARVQTENAARWMQAGEHKLEQDVGVAAGSEGRAVTQRAYSASAKVEDVSVPATVRALRAAFPNAVPTVADDVALAAGCRRILEESWELMPPPESGLPQAVDLTAWYGVSTTGQKLGPVLAELSFKAEHDDPEAMTRAATLAMRLTRTIDPAWLAPGGSKTDTAAACVLQ